MAKRAAPATVVVASDPLEPIRKNWLILVTFCGVVGAAYVMYDKVSRVDGDRTVERSERERLRDKFLENQNKTNEILGKLDTRLTVSEAKSEAANKSLEKIVEQLERLNKSPRR